jgi:(E)-4-hydroxy-3-methylbut-2-enyl-diphosphate synthase
MKGSAGGVGPRYVGGAPRKINLYVGKTAVKFNIPDAESVDRLKDLIPEHGK